MKIRIFLLSMAFSLGNPGFGQRMPYGNRCTVEYQKIGGHVSVRVFLFAVAEMMPMKQQHSINRAESGFCKFRIRSLLISCHFEFPVGPHRKGVHIASNLVVGDLRINLSCSNILISQHFADCLQKYALSKRSRHRESVPCIGHGRIEREARISCHMPSYYL